MDKGYEKLKEQVGSMQAYIAYRRHQREEMVRKAQAIGLPKVKPGKKK